MAWWLRIQFPVVMCHQKSGSVTGWMAAISIVTKMAMVKKCGRSSQRTARASQRSASGSSEDGTEERARLANLLDEEGNEPAGPPGVARGGGIDPLQHPPPLVRAHHVGSHKDGPDQRVPTD